MVGADRSQHGQGSLATREDDERRGGFEEHGASRDRETSGHPVASSVRGITACEEGGAARPDLVDDLTELGLVRSFDSRADHA